MVSGTSPDERLVECIEIREHPWFVRLPVPPRVQEPADASAAAVSRVRRGRARAGDVAAAPDRGGAEVDGAAVSVTQA